MNDTNVRVPVGFESFGPWFNEAFEMLKAQWQTWVLISLVYMAIQWGVSLVLNLLVPLLGSLASLAITCLLLPGVVRVALKQIRGEAFAVGDIFSETGMFVGTLVIGLAIAVGIIACGIGMWVTETLFMLALPLLVDKKMTFGDALKKSYEVTKQNFWFFLVYLFVMGLASSIGIIACGVGYLFTWPIAILGLIVAYERTFNGPAVAAAPAVAPPPPPAPPAPEAPPVAPEAPAPPADTPPPPAE